MEIKIMDDYSEKKIYLAIKNDTIVINADFEIMKATDGIEKPDLVVTEDEYIENDCIARIENGKIVLGRTQEEKDKRAALERLPVLRKQLADTDYVACKIAEDPACRGKYTEILANRKKWREEIASILKK